MRPITLIKVLIKWYKNNYDFAKTLEITRSELEKMEESVRKSSMRNDKFELIRLEEWMREKV